MNVFIKKIIDKKGFSVNLIIFIMMMLIAGKIILTNLRPSNVHKGKGFTITVPEGWEKKKEKHTVTFISPEKDFYNDITEALMMFYSEKTGEALFLDDYFIRVIESLHKSGLKVLDKGEIKIEEVVFKWVLYENSEPRMTVLSFYGVDDFNILYQIQYATLPDKFKKHRKTFEDVKNSFKFSKFGM